MKHFQILKSKPKLMILVALIVFACSGAYLVWKSSAYMSCPNPHGSNQVVELYFCDGMNLTSYNRDQTASYFSNPANGAIDIYTNLSATAQQAQPLSNDEFELVLTVGAINGTDSGSNSQVKRLDCLWRSCFSSWSYHNMLVGDTGIGKCWKLSRSDFNGQRVHLGRFYVQNDKDNPTQPGSPNYDNNLRVSLVITHKGGGNPQTYNGAFNTACDPVSNHARTFSDFGSLARFMSTYFDTRIGISRVNGTDPGQGPGGGGSNNQGDGDNGEGNGSGGGAGSGGGRSSATHQSENPNNIPSSSSQGDNEQTEIVPSPFFDGKEYARASDADTLADTAKSTGKKIVRTWPVVLAVLALGGGAGYWYWRWKRHLQ